VELHERTAPVGVDDEDATLARLLRALADHHRRRLLDRLRDTPGLTQGALAGGFTLSRQALSKHLAVLEAAELVVTRWRGREKLHYLNPQPLEALPARWVTTSARDHDKAIATLKRALDGPHAPAPRGDALARLLAAAPALDGSRIATAQDLAVARRYLEGTAEAVRLIVERLPADGGRTPPAGGGFSIAGHLWHLADVEEFGWAQRLPRLLAESKPRLPGVDGDRLAVERRYH